MKRLLFAVLLGSLLIWNANADLASDIIANSDVTEGNTVSANDLAFLLVLAPAALADSINPCAFAILFLLLTSILSKTNSMKKAAFSGLMYIFSIFVSYLAMGIWLYQALASTTNMFALKIVVWVLWITIWLLNLKDYFWYGRWGFAFWVPKSWKPVMNKMVMWITSPLWAFFVWLVVSLLLLPCTSGPYITLLWILRSQYEAINPIVYFHLVVYNIIFILPMLVILALVALGKKKVEDLRKARQQNIRTIHLVIGLLMLWLGLYVFVDAFALV